MSHKLETLVIFTIVFILFSWFIVIPHYSNKTQPESDEVLKQEEKRQELINYKLQKQECIWDNWDEFDRLWNEDCAAIRLKEDCELPFGLIDIIEEKIGCED